MSMGDKLLSGRIYYWTARELGGPGGTGKMRRCARSGQRDHRRRMPGSISGRIRAEEFCGSAVGHTIQLNWSRGARPSGTTMSIVGPINGAEGALQGAFDQANTSVSR